MITPTPIMIAFTSVLIASTACISANAYAQARDQQSQRQDSGTANPDEDEQNARGRRADVKASLKLSTEQEKLWGPVEDAVRNLKERTRDLGSSGDPRLNEQIERLRRFGELSTQRADALKKLADAVQPLWATLSDEQKRDLAHFVSITARRQFEMMRERRGLRIREDGEETRDLGRRGQDRMMGRGRNSADDRSMGRPRRDDDWRDEGLHFGENGRRGWSGQRQEQDDVRGRRDHEDDQRRDHVDGYSHRGWQDDYRPRSREWDRGRRDFHQRSERDRCGCDDRD